MIQVRNLVKDYRTKFQENHVLKEVNFDIESESVTAITGTSGCGKSTLLNIMCGLVSADEGSITFDETEITALSHDDVVAFRLNHCGLVFQNFRLISTLNVRENILLPMREKMGVIDESWYDTLINMAGLQSLETSMPFQLSGGEQQRTAIVRALITKPEYIFADEPTGNLDQESTTRVMNFMVELARKEHLTLVFVTHDMDLCSYADRILCIKDHTVKVLQ